MNTNEYLQTEVMGECWHESDSNRIPCSQKCVKCGYPIGIMKPEKYMRDFSTPTDYCALEDKMKELGEWGCFIDWIENERQPEFIWLVWQYLTRTQRAELIAEYWRSRK